MNAKGEKKVNVSTVGVGFTSSYTTALMKKRPLPRKTSMKVASEPRCQRGGWGGNDCWGARECRSHSRAASEGTIRCVRWVPELL